MAVQAVHVLLSGADKAIVTGGEDDLQLILTCMSERLACEPEGVPRQEAAAFLARLSRVVSGVRSFEKLRDMVDTALVLDTHSPGMRTPAREAADALDRAVAHAREDALYMRRSLITALRLSEGRLHPDARPAAMD